MDLVPFGEVTPTAGLCLYRFIKGDAFLSLETTSYEAPEGYDTIYKMGFEEIFTVCVVVLGEDSLYARWWPLDNVEPEWVLAHGLEMQSEIVFRKLFPGLGAWTFGARLLT